MTHRTIHSCQELSIHDLESNLALWITICYSFGLPAPFEFWQQRIGQLLGRALSLYHHFVLLKQPLKCAFLFTEST